MIKSVLWVSRKARNAWTRTQNRTRTRTHTRTAQPQTLIHLANVATHGEIVTQMAVYKPVMRMQTTCIVSHD